MYGTGEPRYIYFFQREDTSAIKIGMALDPLSRYREIQRDCRATRVNLLGVLRTKMFHDKHMHRKFKHLRIEGEWFSPAPELMRFIHKHVTMDSPVIDQARYRKISQMPPCRPICMHCGRVAYHNKWVAGQDPSTGKIGPFHKSCYGHVRATLGLT